MKAAAILALSVILAIGTAAIVRADQSPYPIPEFEVVAANSELAQRAIATARPELAKYSLEDADTYQGFVMRSARSIAVSFIKPGGCDAGADSTPLLTVLLDLEGERVLDSNFKRDAPCKSSL